MSDAAPETVRAVDRPKPGSSRRAQRFGAQLSSRVLGYLDEEHLQRAYARLHRKALLVALWYVASFVMVILADGWIWGVGACISLTLSIVAVGFDIQHDANHNALFPAKDGDDLSQANRLAGLSMNAIGGSAARWITGHVQRHHRAPNVVGRDDDIALSPIGRLAPSQPHRLWHVHQHRYLWVVYSFSAMSIIVGDVSATIKESLTRRPVEPRPRFRDYAGLTFSKLLVAFAFVAVPALRHPWWVVLIGTLAVLWAAGMLLGVVFQLAHTVEGTEFGDGEKKGVPWHEWQVRATSNFSHGRRPLSRILTWYIGGLNYQIEHHLFPYLPHTLYPTIAPIVAATCSDHGIPYRVQPSLRAAVASHYRHLRRLGRP